MRLRAEIWIKAYLRSAAAQGASAMVVRHGDDDRGAIFVKVNRLDGTADLYAPAPTGFGEAADAAALWSLALGPAVREADVEARLTREIGFDSDVWIVEVEDRQGRHFLDAWLVKPQRDDPEVW